MSIRNLALGLTMFQSIVLEGAGNKIEDAIEENIADWGRSMQLPRKRKKAERKRVMKEYSVNKSILKFMKGFNISM